MKSLSALHSIARKAHRSSVSVACAILVQVVVSGSSVDLSAIKKIPKVGAILWIGYGKLNCMT